MILGFARARRSAFVFSSHLTELVSALESDASIRFRCFDGAIENGTPRYTYQLRSGVSDQRLGLVLRGRRAFPNYWPKLQLLEGA